MMKVFSSIDEYKSSRGTRLSYGFEEPMNVQHTTEKLYSSGYDGRDYKITEWWATFDQSQLPGCCGVAVMHNFALVGLKNLGLEDYFQKEREKLCKDAGYSVILATELDKKPEEMKMYLDSGFKKIYSFKNKRTSNLVHILVKDI